MAKKALDEALLANSKRDLERYTKVGTLAVSQQQIDTQHALVEQQEAQVKSDQAAIGNAHAILGYTDDRRADRRAHRPAPRSTSATSCAPPTPPAS